MLCVFFAGAFSYSLMIFVCICWCFSCVDDISFVFVFAGAFSCVDDLSFVFFVLVVFHLC